MRSRRPTPATVAAETAFGNQHADNDEALEELVEALKADLRYAKIAVRDAPQKLNALGWLRRSERIQIATSGPLCVPRLNVIEVYCSRGSRTRNPPDRELVGAADDLLLSNELTENK